MDIKKNERREVRECMRKRKEKKKRKYDIYNKKLLDEVEAKEDGVHGKTMNTNLKEKEGDKKEVQRENLLGLIQQRNHKKGRKEGRKSIKKENRMQENGKR